MLLQYWDVSLFFLHVVIQKLRQAKKARLFSVRLQSEDDLFNDTLRIKLST
jgi:hypothetical protein